jgi:phosphoribosyl 1,2-cyclic phosphate phosphodiesterase
MQPRQAVLTNLHTDLDYATLASTVPEGVHVAHDGMTIVLEEDGAVISP